ncbi:MAG: type II toxin-antitoxin system RelE/ParE family toxin [Chitinispirillaceae bacterium]
MSFLLSIRPEAENDLHETYDWYEKKRRGLGDEFLLRIEAALESVTANPRSCAVVYKNIRRKLIRRFPYGIFFIIDESTIRILAVIHVKRNPENWKSRSDQ